jgi:excisionase family DNA binding protein
MSVVLPEVLKETYSLKEYAAVMGISYQTAKRLRLAGRIPGFKVGGQVRIPRSFVERQLSSEIGEPVNGQ